MTQAVTSAVNGRPRTYSNRQRCLEFAPQLSGNPGLKRGRIGLMAMTAQLKAELASTSVKKSCCRKAEVSAMLRFAGGLHSQSGRIVVEAEFDTGAAARRIRRDLVEIYGHQSEIVVVSTGGIRK